MSSKNKTLLIILVTLFVVLGINFFPKSGNAVPQELPITAQASIHGEIIDLEVAITAQEQSIGLMYRSFLPPNRGMLFIFDSPRLSSFWMKNVEISLDLIFMLGGNVVEIFPLVPPCKDSPCPTYGPSSTKVDQVLELTGGRSAELNLSVGDSVSISFLESTE